LVGPTRPNHRETAQADTAQSLALGQLAEYLSQLSGQRTPVGLQRIAELERQFVSDNGEVRELGGLDRCG
jgi:hypothetical protein